MQPSDSIEITHPSNPRLNRTDWTILAASVIGLFFNFGSIQITTFSVFILPLTEQFNWTFMQVSTATACSGVAAFCSMLVVGWLSDRFGARRLIILSMSLFGVLFASLSLLTSYLWFFYTIFAILGLIGSGTSIVPYASLISRWFTTRRGLALGVMMCGTVIGVAIWPLISVVLIERFDLRVCYALIGGAVLLIALPVLLLFLKQPRHSAVSSILNQTSGLNRREALRSKTFWLLVFVFILHSAIITAFKFILSSLMAEYEISDQSINYVLLLYKPASLIGLLVIGLLLDRVPALMVVALSFAAIILGFSLLLVGVSFVSGCIAASLIGFGAGAEMVAVPYLISLYFGMRSFGEIYNYSFLLSGGLGGVLGPVLMNMGFNLTGSYRHALYLCFVPMLIAAVLLLRLRLSQSFKEIKTVERQEV